VNGSIKRRAVKRMVTEQSVDSFFQNNDDKSIVSESHREMQSLRETCAELERKNDKLSHDLNAKEALNSGLQVLVEFRH
jgi:uncharacterized membrane-anchored protein